MGKEIIIYLVIFQVEQRNFHQQKNETIYHVNINRIVVSSKVPFGRKGFKYFIGYKNGYEKLCPVL